jgi:hypothetical protein
MSFVRNTEGVIINTDDSYYRALVAQRESEKKARDVINKMSVLESELTEIRAMLAQITNRD